MKVGDPVPELLLEMQAEAFVELMHMSPGRNTRCSLSHPHEGNHISWYMGYINSVLPPTILEIWPQSDDEVVMDQNWVRVSREHPSLG